MQSYVVKSSSHSYSIALYNITGEDPTSQQESQVRPVQSEHQDMKKEITPQQSPPTSGTYTSFIHSLSSSVLLSHICICSGSHSIALYNITGEAESQVTLNQSESQDLKKEITPQQSPPTSGTYISINHSLSSSVLHSHICRCSGSHSIAVYYITGEDPTSQLESQVRPVQSDGQDLKKEITSPQSSPTSGTYTSFIHSLSSSVLHSHICRCSGSHSIALYNITGEDPTSQQESQVRPFQSDSQDLKKEITSPQSSPTSGTYTSFIHSLSSSVLHSHICICSGSHSIALYNIIGEDPTSQQESQVRPVQSDGQDLKKEITSPQSTPTSGTYTSFIHSLSSSVLHSHICICSGSHSIALYNITGEAESQVTLNKSESQDLKKEITPQQSPPTSGTYISINHSLSSSVLHSHICRCSGSHSIAVYNITGEDPTSQLESQVRPVQSDGQDLKKEITSPQSSPTSGTYTSFIHSLSSSVLHSHICRCSGSHSIALYNITGEDPTSQQESQVRPFQSDSQDLKKEITSPQSSPTSGTYTSFIHSLSSSVPHSHICICSGSHSIALYNIIGEDPTSQQESQVRPVQSDGQDLKKEITSPQSSPTSGTYTSFIHSLSSSVLHSHICICSGSHSIALYNITGEAESQVTLNQSESQDLKKEITPQQSPPTSGTYISINHSLSSSVLHSHICRCSGSHSIALYNITGEDPTSQQESQVRPFQSDSQDLKKEITSPQSSPTSGTYTSFIHSLSSSVLHSHICICSGSHSIALYNIIGEDPTSQQESQVRPVQSDGQDLKKEITSPQSSPTSGTYTSFIHILSTSCSPTQSNLVVTVTVLLSITSQVRIPPVSQKVRSDLFSLNTKI